MFKLTLVFQLSYLCFNLKNIVLKSVTVIFVVDSIFYHQNSTRICSQRNLLILTDSHTSIDNDISNVNTLKYFLCEYLLVM